MRLSDLSSIDPSIRMILPVLEDYTDWYGRVVRCVFYPESESGALLFDVPESFERWRKAVANEKSIESVELERIEKVHRELNVSAKKLLEVAVHTRTRPGFDLYEEFANLFDDLVGRLHRLEIDSLLGDRGFDPVTGLRSQQVMFKDMGREMDRLARRGRPFALVFGRFDNTEQLERMLGSDFEKALRWAAGGILGTLRTFDDAYRFNRNEFVITLKHADILGAQRFVERLRDYHIKNPFLQNGRVTPLTLSFCVAEPVVGEDLKAFIEQMRLDFFKNIKEEKEAVIKYEETSPLQRFLTESGVKKR